MRRMVSAIVLVAAATAGLFYLTHEPELPLVDPVANQPPALVKTGRTLSELGGCRSCHTRDGGEPYAGGLPIETPFGVLYSSNITPDRKNGIGGWSLEAFSRAMRKGVGRTGAHLYPAFPYDHFARMNDEDIQAIHAYLNASVKASSQTPPANAMRFPWNIRRGLAGWKFLFLDARAPADPSRDEEWTRGAYLAESVGHCGACHSPRNALGAIDARRAYAGAFVNGWYAPALNQASPAPIPWTKLSLVDYLIDGWQEHHGIAAGSMTAVTNALRDMPEDDVFAIATYIASLAGPERSSEAQKKLEEAALRFAKEVEWEEGKDASTDSAGARTFQAHCARCHSSGKSVPLGLNSALNLPDPTNVVRVMFSGIKPPQGALGKSMPAFGAQISDAEAVALVHFMRARFTRREPWADVEGVVLRERGRK